MVRIPMIITRASHNAELFLPRLPTSLLPHRTVFCRVSSQREAHPNPGVPAHGGDRLDRHERHHPVEVRWIADLGQLRPDGCPLRAGFTQRCSGRGSAGRH
uniref:(northern house mosquito) hypothetical protein n=1 Tax=Culex pipiens TaxID=7175 RepID=A0A8D8BM12_CULPI